MAVESPALLMMIEATFRMYRPLAEETEETPKRLRRDPEETPKKL